MLPARASCSVNPLRRLPSSPKRLTFLPFLFFSPPPPPTSPATSAHALRLPVSPGVTGWLGRASAGGAAGGSARWPGARLCSAPAGLRRSPALHPQLAVPWRAFLKDLPSENRPGSVKLFCLVGVFSEEKKKKKKKSPLAFQFAKVTEKYLGWKEGGPLFLLSVQSSLLHFSVLVGKEAVAHSQGCVCSLVLFCFFIANNLTLVCQAGILVRKAKVNAVARNTEEPFSLLNRLGKSHLSYNFIGFASRWSLAVYVCPR